VIACHPVVCLVSLLDAVQAFVDCWLLVVAQ
jgi:hypothetical protein